MLIYIYIRRYLLHYIVFIISCYYVINHEAFCFAFKLFIFNVFFNIIFVLRLIWIHIIDNLNNNKITKCLFNVSYIPNIGKNKYKRKNILIIIITYKVTKSFSLLLHIINKVINRILCGRSRIYILLQFRSGNIF